MHIRNNLKPSHGFQAVAMGDINQAKRRGYTVRLATQADCDAYPHDIYGVRDPVSQQYTLYLVRRAD